MKRIFTLSTVTLVAVFLFTGCIKQAVFQIDENYWFSKERGQVVYSTPTCGYYAVQTNDGYTVVRTLGTRPYEGDILYGNFSGYGSGSFYDHTAGIIISGDVKEYWLSYTGAQQAISYYCY
jgi:hypothetical protein